MSTLTRRDFIQTSAAAAASASLLQPLSLQARIRADNKPNIIIFFVDDMPYDLLSFTNPDGGAPTPNIDSLGSEGAFFTSGYIAQAWCGPSRAGLLTGRHPRRFGFTWNYSPFPTSGEKKEFTIAEVMADAGYVTGIVGKYGNLGGNTADDPRAIPMDHGFQDCFWYPSGGHKNVATPEEPHEDLYRNHEPITGETDFLPLIWGREAANFVNKYHDKPFFLYVPFNQPHGPIEATQEYLDKFPNVSDPEKKALLALMAGTDDAVGMILEAVRQNNLDNDTVIIFSNDNGRGRSGIGNGPYSGGKHDYTEGGVRVPTFCRWTGHIPAGTEYPHPISSLDFLPTAAGLAGAALPENKVFDGVNFMPYVLGEKSGVPHEVLFWFAQSKNDPNTANELRALRFGDWKVLAVEERVNDEKVFKWYLMHLPTNPGEQTKHNKNAEEPELLAKLVTAAQEAEAQILADQPLELDLPDYEVSVRGRNKGKTRPIALRHFNNGLSHRFHLQLHEAAPITRVEIIDMKGRVVRVLATSRLHDGYYSLNWDGMSAGGERCGKGAYVIRALGTGINVSKQFMITQ